MNYSTQFIAAIVGILSAILPKIGIVVVSEELTSIVSSLLTVASGLYVMYNRTKLQSAPNGKGDVNITGLKK